MSSTNLSLVAVGVITKVGFAYVAPAGAVNPPSTVVDIEEKFAQKPVDAVTVGPDAVVEIDAPALSNHCIFATAV
jgi:hypothetical protein